MNIKQKITVVAMDVMLVLELALCMYLGQRTGDDLTAFFIKTYLPALLATVAVARFFIRRWEAAPPDSTGASGDIPSGDGAVGGTRV